MSTVSGFLTVDDARLLADSIPAGSSAVLVLIENTWATKMMQAIADAQGEVLISDRIPRAVVDQLELEH